MAAEQKMPNSIKFLFGGLAGMAATCFVQPLDLVKTRMQVSGTDGKKEYRNSFHCIQTVISKEGPLALYKGIGAALLRQATYTTARLGTYTWMNDQYRIMYNSDPNFVTRATMGMIAGAIGAFVGTPADLALIRMSADGRLPPAERRNYKNVANALTRIAREEGPLKLFSGCVPTVSRAVVVNMTQLASYSQAKKLIKKELSFKDGIGLHFAASMVSGLLTTIASMPVDIVKTRIQNMKTVNGKPEYSGGLDVLSKVIRNEGVLALWKGFTPYYCRVGPHTVLTFIYLEQMNQMYFKHVLGKEGGSSGI